MGKPPINSHEDEDDWRPKNVMEPSTTFRHRVPINNLNTKITPNSDVFVLAHFGIPRIALNDWRLHFSGMFDCPRTMTIDDIRAFPKHQIESYIKCAGFPDDHRIATRNASNALWGGALLTDVMRAVGLSPEADFLWFYAPDHGSYGKWSADRYLKDVSVKRLSVADILLAYEVNNEPLPAEHGFPLRVFIPGYYGTNSVKWLCRIDAAKVRAPDIFTNELYNDPVFEEGKQTLETSPVWGVAPEALIVAPENGATILRGNIAVSGWCWGEHEIVEVQLSLDHGQNWISTAPEFRIQNSWQAFTFRVHVDTPGNLDLLVRAIDELGQTQSAQEARNSIHRIEINVA